MTKIQQFFSKYPLVLIAIISILLGFLTVLTGSSVSSFVYAYFPMEGYVNDGNMFYYLGKLLAEGNTPYTDFFDHKGLYLMYYSALGVLLGGRGGFFIVQTLTLSVVYYFMILSFRILNVKRAMTITGLLLFLAAFCLSMQSPGDYELELPFIAASIYFFVKGIKEDSSKDFLLASIFSGITAGIAINIRMSDAMVSFGLMVAYVIICLKNKKIKDLFVHGFICIGAIIITCLPPLIHSLVGGFAVEMYTSIILDNFKYIGTTGNRFDSHPTLMKILLSVIAILYLVTIFFARKKINKDEVFLYSISGLIIFFVQIMIAFYAHYILIMLPYLCFIIPRLIDGILGDTKKWHISFEISSVALGIFSLLFYPIHYYVDVYEMDQHIISLINDNISQEDIENDKVLCLTCSSGIYLNMGITTPYPDFACQYNHVMLSSYYTEERILDYFRSEECHYFITWGNAVENAEDTYLGWFLSEEGKALYSRIINDHIDIYKLNSL